jgi:hypothetical protein
LTAVDFLGVAVLLAEVLPFVLLTAFDLAVARLAVRFEAVVAFAPLVFLATVFFAGFVFLVTAIAFISPC